MSGLFLFLLEPKWPGSETVFRLLLKGYVGDHRTHGGRERRLDKGGVGEGQTDGLMDR